MPTVDDLTTGVTVFVTEEAGLPLDREYRLTDVDPVAQTVRFAGIDGTYSMEVIEGFDPQVASQTGIFRNAPSRGLPSIDLDPAGRSTMKPVLGGEHAGLMPKVEVPAVKDVLGDLTEEDLVRVLETHLTELSRHAEAVVRYHAHTALQIVWALTDVVPDEETQKTT